LSGFADSGQAGDASTVRNSTNDNSAIDNSTNDTSAIDTSAIDNSAINVKRRRKMLKMNVHIRSAAIVSALVFASLAARAATFQLKASLDAASEVPAKISSGTGTLTATLNTETEELKYHIVFKDLTGPPTAAHFHGPAAVGVNAGPQVPIATKPLESPIDGTATLTASQAKDLLDGKWYFNVHTAANPAGEIRGQIVKAE
jgi:hypothetical protein